MYVGRRPTFGLLECTEKNLFPCYTHSQLLSHPNILPALAFSQVSYICRGIFRVFSGEGRGRGICVFF